jgi:hydrogenase maturation protein HypF
MRAKTPLAPGLAPGLAEVGIMLAYTPLHDLLFDQGPQVLVMTSFNRPGDPMLTTTAEAVRLLGTACDGVLSHGRTIISRCDDSVWRLHGDQPRLLRRSRGYAPLPVALGAEAPAILACGAGEKVTICLTRGSQAFFSQHLGETRSPAGQEHYSRAAAHLQALLHITPQIVAHDLHPDYHSSRFTAAFTGLQKIAVQHHHAHIVSCMVEHNLHRPVIGLALDGTGLGPDHSLWGGEVLLCDRRHFRRLAHFAPLAMPGGEAAISHPWRLALAWLHQEGLQQRELAFLRKITNNDRLMVGQMLASGLNCPPTTSLGRLFDAVAALINLRGRITFAAQAAMELEAIADDHEQGSYPMTISAPGPDAPLRLETGALLHAIVDDLDRGTGQAIIARRFHNTIIRALTTTCLRLAEAEGLAEVACSGGVFQNRLLSEGLRRALQDGGLTVHCHQKIPCNDGGLALGQAAVAAALCQPEVGPDRAATRHA